MRKVFTHENRLIVFHMRNLLQEQGIASQLRNEFAGGGVGDLSPFETWPELWVGDEDFNQASSIIEMNDSGDSRGGRWVCPKCGEVNDRQFRLCWRCSSANESVSR